VTKRLIIVIRSLQGLRDYLTKALFD